MNGCALSLSVKLPDYINPSEFMGCNLNPVVVLTDIRKALGSSSASPVNYASEKIQSESKDSKKGSKESFKAKSKRTIKLKSPRSTSTLSLSIPKQMKSIKRKRESWDPSVEYEIEKIVGYHRDKRKKMWYFVKWKNWPNDYNTFEPIDNLTGCHYKLMKYFETSCPSSDKIQRKDMELWMALTERHIYKKLLDGNFRVEDVSELSLGHPDDAQMFKMKLPELQLLMDKIQMEYKFIVRCLIGMRSHQDPGLILRGQNYKFLLIFLDLRLKQLQKLALVENSINSREQTEIIIENEVDLEDFPDINYIGEMIAGDGVELPKDPLLGCECSDGCTPHSRCCGTLKDSTFAYKYKDKLRLSERIAIYECNSRCRCPPSCPNRVVQRGRKVRLCIFKTKSCGWGVKALEKIPRGSFVCEYLGELIPDSEAVLRDLNYYGGKQMGYLFDLDFFTDSKLEMYCIDATEHGNVARFINHSCDPNLVVYPVWIDGIEPNKHRLGFFARRNIQRGEEIQFDYENLEEFSSKKLKINKKSHGLRMLSNVRCQCNAANCRKWIFGNK